VTNDAVVQELADAILRGIAAGKAVEVEGLGTFRLCPRRGFRFEPTALSQVFIAYVKEDEEAASRLFDDLGAAGFDPWMDARKLVPGQNWPRAIERAIESSAFFIACFSEQSVSKRGGFQSEIRYALDCARRIPLDDIFIVPVRLTPCRVPRSLQRELQYIDLFPDWGQGVARVTAMMAGESRRREPSHDAS
jgi:hypothetical protein